MCRSRAAVLVVGFGTRQAVFLAHDADVNSGDVYNGAGQPQLAVSTAVETFSLHSGLRLTI